MSDTKWADNQANLVDSEATQLHTTLCQKGKEVILVVHHSGQNRKAPDAVNNMSGSFDRQHRIQQCPQLNQGARRHTSNK